MQWKKIRSKVENIFKKYINKAHIFKIKIVSTETLTSQYYGHSTLSGYKREYKINLMSFCLSMDAFHSTSIDVTYVFLAWGHSQPPNFSSFRIRVRVLLHKKVYAIFWGRKYSCKSNLWLQNIAYALFLILSRNI